MKYYMLEPEISFSTFQVIKIGFGEPTTNANIVSEVASTAPEIAAKCHGKVVLFNGPASLPVALCLAHTFAHVTRSVGVYDPKIAGYIICISHDPAYSVGAVIYPKDIH